MKIGLNVLQVKIWNYFNISQQKFSSISLEERTSMLKICYRDLDVFVENEKNIETKIIASKFSDEIGTVTSRQHLCGNVFRAIYKFLYGLS